MARTDARAGLGLEEALERCRKFRRIGADITFLEAPQSEEEMRRYCQEVDGPKLANMLEVIFYLTGGVGWSQGFLVVMVLVLLMLVLVLLVLVLLVVVVVLSLLCAL